MNVRTMGLVKILKGNQKDGKTYIYEIRLENENFNCSSYASIKNNSTIVEIPVTFVGNECRNGFIYSKKSLKKQIRQYLQSSNIKIDNIYTA